MIGCMKKLQKNMILLCSLLFIGQLCQASFITRLSGFSLVIGASLTKRAYDYFEQEKNNAMDMAVDAMMFPHSLEWYENLAKKYPEAHFDQKKFRSGFQWGAHGDYNIIYAHFSDLNRIEVAASSKENQYSFPLETDKDMQERIQYIAGLEAIALHEAGHIEHKHSAQALLVVVGTVIPLEICYQAYMKRIPQAPVKNLSGSLWNFAKSTPRRIGLFAAMSHVSGLAILYNSREHEKQADAFACKHADLPALHGFAKSFEENISKEIPSTNPKFAELFATHPSSSSRLIAVQQEIARRELAKIK